MASVEIRQVDKYFGSDSHPPRGRDRHPGRRVRRPGRALGLRQVDPAAHDRRARGDQPGRDRDRRAGGQHVPPKDRDIAMVFQNYALYPHMTVRQNMAFSLKLAQGAARPTIDERVGRAAAILGLETAARPLSRASSRAASASASPWAGPSSAIRRCSCSTSRCRTSTPSCACRCAPRSRSCTSGCKTTSIYVTHDQIEAMTMADRIVVMQHGVVEQMGAPLELYDRPANLFVAGFIGSPAMNFIEATVHRNGGPPVAIAGDGTQPAAAGRRAGCTMASRHRLRRPARASAAAGDGRRHCRPR